MWWESGGLVGLKFDLFTHCKSQTSLSMTHMGDVILTKHFLYKDVDRLVTGLSMTVR